MIVALSCGLRGSYFFPFYESSKCRFFELVLGRESQTLESLLKCTEP